MLCRGSQFVGLLIIVVTLQVWRTCLLDNGERANIITFYNEVFMPRFKDYILHWVCPLQLCTSCEIWR